MFVARLKIADHRHYDHQVVKTITITQMTIADNHDTMLLLLMMMMIMMIYDDDYDYADGDDDVYSKLKIYYIGMESDFFNCLRIDDLLTPFK